MRRLATAALALGLLVGPFRPAHAQPAEEPQEEPVAASPTLILRAFGAIQWGATERPDVPSQFSLGQFAIFATSTIGERVSVLAEIVMEAGIDTRVVTDLERLQLTFRVNDYLNVSAGRYHNGIGFYNTAFHHGAYFEVPIGRPRVFAFEDEGGILPIHDVGVTVRGAVPKTGRALYYLAEVGNGGIWGTAGHGQIEAGHDTSGARATNVGFSFRPERWRGLEIGTSFYRDTARPEGMPTATQRVGAVFVVYRTPSVELMAEWLNLQYETAEGPRFHNNAGYAQVSRAWGAVRPYYRFDRLATESATPVIGARGPYTGHVLGVRVEAAQWVGLKAQYERSDDHAHRGINAVRTQLVFVF